MPKKFILAKAAVPSKLSIPLTKVPKKRTSSEAREEASVKKSSNSSFFVTEQ